MGAMAGVPKRDVGTEIDPAPATGTVAANGSAAVAMAVAGGETGGLAAGGASNGEGVPKSDVGTAEETAGATGDRLEAAGEGATTGAAGGTTGATGTAFGAANGDTPPSIVGLDRTGGLAGKAPLSGSSHEDDSSSTGTSAGGAFDGLGGGGIEGPFGGIDALFGSGGASGGGGDVPFAVRGATKRYAESSKSELEDISSTSGGVKPPGRAGRRSVFGEPGMGGADGRWSPAAMRPGPGGCERR